MKTCACCKIEKNESEFKPSKQQKSGLFPYCGACVKKKAEESRRRRGIKPLRRKENYITDTKVCNGCGIEKDKQYFRRRTEKRVEYVFTYLNNTCKACDALASRKAYQEIRKTPEGRKKNCESAKKAYWKRREKALAHMKVKRELPENIERRKKYDADNAPRIRELGKERNVRYVRKMMTEKPLEYAARQIKAQTGIPLELIRQNEQLLIAKNLIIQIKRKANDKH